MKIRKDGRNGSDRKILTLKLPFLNGSLTVGAYHADMRNIKEKKTKSSAGPRTLAVGLLFAALSAAAAPVFSQQTFSTTVYFDWTRFVTNDGYRTSADKDNYFAFRRAYFTYENKINDRLKFRFRLDADNTANLTGVTVDPDTGGVTTKTDDKLRPFIKNIYLEYSNLIPNSAIRAGMIETLTFKAAEDHWGYRSVAKTMMDGYKDVTGVDLDASSADLGASLTGSASKYIRYGVMVSNGSGYSHAEGDKYKKIMAQAQFVPMAGLSLVGYVDYEKQNGTNSAHTYKIDGYLEMVRDLTIGAEWFTYRNEKNVVSTNVYSVGGFSVFGRYVIEADKLGVFARYDRYDPNSLADNDGIGLVIAGVDWAPFHKSWKLQPNIWLYDYKDPAKKNDVMFNMTFCMTF